MTDAFRWLMFRLTLAGPIGSGDKESRYVHMSEWDSLHFSSKRAVKTLNASLAELSTGSIITAYIRSDSYGPLAVTGALTAGDPPTVGMHDIGVSGKPSRDLWGLELLDTLPEETPLGVSASTLTHGDVVRATFQQRPYGDFTILGIAVAAPTGPDFLVGSWLLTRDGADAPRLQALEVVAKAGSHDLAIPARPAVWPSNKENTPQARFATPTELQLELDAD
jgi:hypothetical protein